jgi:hypothetical protein
METARFEAVLDAVEELTVDEQETLVDILKHRIAEHRRMELGRDVADAQPEFQRDAPGTSRSRPGGRHRYT